MSDEEVEIPEAPRGPNPAEPWSMHRSSGKDLLIVGIGASAGGLTAFEAFFSGLQTPEPGMAFVLVQHLAPDHKSILTDLIRRCTPLRVLEVQHGMAVEINSVYIIPPNRNMACVEGKLLLTELAMPRGQRLPIDFFFRSLALDRQDRAIGIVLAGTGSDGTQGLRAIKEVGGMVMAQDPASTEHDGMPRSAIAAGLVDYQLPPAVMPAQLLSYAAQVFGGHAPLSREALAASDLDDEAALKLIFELLRARTGHDFSLYKPNTILRRTERRMAIHQIEAIQAYVRYLQQSPIEVEALFRDLLIGVTRFFRDPEAFQALKEQVIPRLFEGKNEGGEIRVWCPGCSSGEEAYSIAILIQEHKDSLALDHHCQVQVFATDIDDRAIAFARAGVYTADSLEGIAPERLERFFNVEAGRTYSVRKALRDLLVFSVQDLVKDPPFSRLDMVSCRNLLIYMGAELQKKVFPLFNFALNPGGFLFLGSSESAGDSGEWFTTLDRANKLYQRKENGDDQETKRLSLVRLLQSAGAAERTFAKALGTAPYPMKPRLRELTEQALLQSATQVAALVDGQGNILYLHGRAGQYLEPAPGEAGVNNVLVMAREGLQRELTTALHKAVATDQAVSIAGLRIWINGAFVIADLTVRPVPASQAKSFGTPLYLVILDEAALADTADGTPDTGADNPATGSEANVAALKRELKAKEEYLQITNEELRTANEELRSSNEEMQSMNEELQSANEELETSKEELQSVNEEASTINSELQIKVAELSRANNDMNNLLAGTGIATVFVDLRLRILRFTPAATSIINLIPGDVNRPVNHVVSNLAGYDRLAEDLNLVLDTLAPKVVEVRTKNGLWYNMRIQPYRTLENIVEGAVITFVDVNEMKMTTEALRDTQAKLLAAEGNG